MDLSPARWIWFPSQRTLANTFVLFRHTVILTEPLVRANGWLAADSRYRLTVNGKRVQWGPAPADPRSMEVDPMDLTALLQPGENVIGVEVLFYGYGEGTWLSGKPGLLFSLNLEYTDGTREQIVSDTNWLCFLDRAHAPGQYKRWYLRALQEDFDARLHPYGWDTTDFTPDHNWLHAQDLHVKAMAPAASGAYRDYAEEASLSPLNSELRPRSIPLLREVKIPTNHMVDAGIVRWKRDPRDWFEMRTPSSFTIKRDMRVIHTSTDHNWELKVPEKASDALFVTFVWAEQLVGWPYFTLEASEGTIVELMCQEAHDPDPEHSPWLDTHFFSWSRFTCREGLNRFETFDFECLRWLQLHIRNARPGSTLKLSYVGMRRRLYDWPHQAQVHCSEPPLQRLFDASINTLYNCAQETCVDGMGRERQQYSGDAGHQLHAIRSIFGETRLPARFLQTYSMGQTHEGYFLDSWPGYDRIARIGQRQRNATPWGVLLDHSVGFVFDTWHHYLETGDIDAVSNVYPRLRRFAHYLYGLRDQSGLLPVDNLGVPTVWIDHHAYLLQRHKQCAFNLYAAAMLSHALAPLAWAFGDSEQAREAEQWGAELLEATQHRFWDDERGIFINNRPWLAEEYMPRLCDRSLATAILYDQCPGGRYKQALHELANCPPEMGLSFPANAGWRYWALARGGRVDLVLKDFRERWATMPSVIDNNTLQEDWQVTPDSTSQWSHCGVVPLYFLAMDVAGVRPTEPGFARYQIRPQLADLPDLTLTIHTPHGPLRFHAHSLDEGGHRVTFHTPRGGEGVLIVPRKTALTLPEVPGEKPARKVFQLEANREYTFVLPPSH